MKIIDFLFPIYELDPERVTEQIKQTYTDLSNKPLSSERKIKATLSALIVFLLFGGLSLVALRQSGVVTQYQIAYLAPLLVLFFLVLLSIWGSVALNKMSTALVFPQISIFASIVGLVLLVGSELMQTAHMVAIYYGLLTLHFLLIIAMYRADYKKFPEIAYKNSQSKRSGWWLIILLFYPVGLFAAQNLSYGLLGVGMLMFALYLCHVESLTIILARFRPQAVKIAHKL